MTYGTSHFTTKAAAVRYYRAYEDEPSKAVERKLAEGQIHIGIPELRDGQSCYVNAEEGRYFITDGAA